MLTFCCSCKSIFWFWKIWCKFYLHQVWITCNCWSWVIAIIARVSGNSFAYWGTMTIVKRNRIKCVFRLEWENLKYFFFRNSGNFRIYVKTGKNNFNCRSRRCCYCPFLFVTIWIFVRIICWLNHCWWIWTVQRNCNLP